MPEELGNDWRPQLHAITSLHDGASTTTTVSFPHVGMALGLLQGQKHPFSIPLPHGAHTRTTHARVMCTLTRVCACLRYDRCVTTRR